MNNINWGIFVSPIIGGIIGYFTNWLAIKMLFRPKNEISIGKFKVPFTPGVIPKEKKRLAKKLGVTVGEHLITAEVLQNAIEHSSIIENAESYLDNFINDAIEKKYTVDDILNNTLKEKKEIYIENINSYINSNLDIQRDNINSKLKDILNEYSIKILKDYHLSNISPTLLNELEIIINNFITEYLTQDEIIDFLRNFYDKKLDELKSNNIKVNEIISKKNIITLKNFLKKHIHKVPDFIRNLPENNPELDENFKDLIRKIIDESVNPFVGTFISSRKIYKSIKDGIIDFFEDEEKINSTELKLYEITDIVLEKNINIYLDKIDRDDIENIIIYIGKYISNIDKDNLKNKIFDFSKKSFSKYEELDFYTILNKILPNFDIVFDKTIENVSNKITNEIIIKIKNEIPTLENKLLNYKIEDMINNVGEEKISIVKEKLLHSFKKAVNYGSGYISKNINIPKIVEDQINSFGVDDAEKIILDVVKKELNVITVLGGVLGFVIGFIPIIFK